MKIIILATSIAFLFTGISHAHEAHNKAGADVKAASTELSPVLSGKYELDKTHASLIWRVKHMGLSFYTARFTDFDITLSFDAKHPAQSTLEASINPTSIRTDWPHSEEEDFDKVLSTDAKWFNADAFPEITFKATGIELTGDNTGKITGDLSLLGVTRPVILDVTLNGSHEKRLFAGVPTLGFSAKTTIKRSDWGLNTYLPAVVGDEVQIIIEAEFIQPKD